MSFLFFIRIPFARIVLPRFQTQRLRSIFQQREPGNKIGAKCVEGFMGGMRLFALQAQDRSQGWKLQDQREQFERAIWPHLRGAYNLARWLVGNQHDAEDIVQESFIKAFRAVDRIRMEDVRAWLFTIVRNTALNYLQREKPRAAAAWSREAQEPVDHSAGPETRLLLEERSQRVRSAIGRLPVEFREPLVLREVEGLSYKEIAWVLKIPMGTVMSRLSRARNLLLQELLPEEGGAR